jgi:hypothetical protein
LFELDGLQVSAPTIVSGTLIVQKFTCGSFSLYHPDNTLLLSGDLSKSALTGTLGLSGGMLFTTSFSRVTGGALAPHLDSESLILQMDMSSINDGDGLSAALAALPLAGELQPFTAQAIVDIEAERIPEPALGVLLGLAVALSAAFAARRPRPR